MHCGARIRLRAASTRRVDVIELAAATRAEVIALHARVLAAGCREIHSPRELPGPFGGYGFRFFSPDGLPFGISCDVAQRAARDIGALESVPVRISHIVLHSPDHQAMVRFFTEVLGFRVSDWLGDFMCFLRCNEWHHRIAMLPGPPCLNHVAYDMASLDAMMRGVSRLRTEGVEVQWGPGRHKAGNNTFSYFVTPNDFAVEYTAELERVDEATWQPTLYKPEQGLMDLWGIGTGGPHTEREGGKCRGVPPRDQGRQGQPQGQGGSLRFARGLPAATLLVLQIRRGRKLRRSILLRSSVSSRSRRFRASACSISRVSTPPPSARRWRCG